MNYISYFKLQAKNLFHDIKLDFMQEDGNYVCSPRFFDVNAVVSAFDVDTDNFSLMKAQHIIAQIVGMNSWKELINASDAVLGQKKITLDASDFKIKHQNVNYINLSQYEKIVEGQRGDYLLKCPRLPELEEIIKRKPDSYCLSACPENKDDFDALFNDKEHIYVNVIPQWNSVRVLVPGAKFPDWYAVQVGNIKVS